MALKLNSENLHLGLSNIKHRKKGQNYNFLSDDTLFLKNDLKKTKNFQLFGGIPFEDIYNLLGLVIVSFFVRLYNIDYPESIVFEESHFGKSVSQYIKRSFFLDYDPPLVRLLFAFVGFLFGIDNDWDEEIYNELGIPYVALRFMSGIMGVLIIPIAYLTIKSAGFSRIAAFLVSSLLIFENGLITQGRLILHGSSFLTFTAFTFLMWVKFYTEEKRPFKLWWWVWMALTGVGLGLTISASLEGFFTMVFIGLLAIKYLWDLLSDLRTSFTQIAKNIFANTLCLIIIPVILYIIFFFIHIAILKYGGADELYISPEFRKTLNEYSMDDTPIDVAYDSVITLRHVVTGGYLHSHQIPYPRSQDDDTHHQVSLLMHVGDDEDNFWTIRTVKFAESPENTKESQELQESKELQESLDWIYDGALIHLEHFKTERSLHSNVTEAPISDGEFQKEVSARLFEGFLDTTDLWNVEIAESDKSDPESSERLRAINTKFRLYNHETRCYLFSHFIKLPAWGSDEIEVTCATNANYQNSLWYIETNSHPDLPEDAEMVNYKRIGFFRKFYETIVAMWEYRNERYSYASTSRSPLSWLFLNDGVSFWEDKYEERQIYLFGNPFVWYTSTLAVFGFVAAKLGIMILEKRRISNFSTAKAKHFESWAGILFTGWLLHYLPYLLGYGPPHLHYYFPSLYFAILLIGIGFDLLTERLTYKNRIIIAAIFLVASIYVFTLFSPITYGGPWTRSECNRVKLLNSWKYNCDLYDKNYIEEKEEIIEIDYENSPGSYYTKSPAFLTQVVEAETTYTTQGMELW
ncbi:glycosyltransferase family 39 protein [Gigaspora margarita]|uniref:Dolichyl-phosphate-mannose--protein mannosyltransferase n=1 Tax=Gigaspora margarita TaxID=4874 RepID=A0A8H3XEH8_GIGMA|nr:glycosyltransferase family 39 protein [Gigaspora margarita]